MDIESHTIIYLREMLSTAVVEDASITAFLSCWAYEEHFHSRVLNGSSKVRGLRSTIVVSPTLRRRQPSDYLAQGSRACCPALTRHFPAVHMTWGAINEFSTLTGYHALIDRTGHPLLTTVLSRIIKDERRHFSFYFNQARLRLQPRAAADTYRRGLEEFLESGRKTGARRRRRSPHMRLPVRRCTGAAPPRRARLDGCAASRSAMVRPRVALLLRLAACRGSLRSALNARSPTRPRDHFLRESTGHRCPCRIDPSQIGPAQSIWPNRSCPIDPAQIRS